MGTSATWKEDRGRWQVQARVHGLKRCRLAPVGMKKREALRVVGAALMDDLEAEARRLGATPSRTLAEFCEVYRASHPGVSDRTWAARRPMVEDLVVQFGHVPMATAPTTAEVGAWVRDLAALGPLREHAPERRGKPCGPWAVHNYVTALQAVYREAASRNVIAAVPFVAPRWEKPTKKARALWPPAMIAAVLRVAKHGAPKDGRTPALAPDPVLYRMIRLVQLTGCRPVETLRLRWDVDVSDVPRALRLRSKKRERFVPVEGDLAALLDEIPRVNGCQWLFPAERYKEPRPFSCWPKARWRAVCARAGVPRTIYDLRHGFITEAVARGVSTDLIAEYVGNSVTTIEAHYSHLKPAHLRGVAPAHAPSESSDSTAGATAGGAGRAKKKARKPS